MYIFTFSKYRDWFFFTCCFLFVSACSSVKNSNSASQNPSPMTESIRPHHRVSAEDCLGQRMPFVFYEKNAQLFIPEGYNPDLGTNLIIHFHGMPKVVEFSICESSSAVLLSINGGSGSSSYEKIFEANNSFEEVLNRVLSEMQIKEFASVTLSCWSAGYGAVRAIISQNESMIDKLVLLDGLHTSYIPENQTLYSGGKLDSIKLTPFISFAEKASTGTKQMIITHSSVFPGTFASTTECVDYLISKLSLERKTALMEGPVGMQQVAELNSGNLSILSYAGNTAPDHVDHLHGLKYFLEKLNFEKLE